jgi:predicted nuclease of restriction endonuclease-like (RecB) superfamily
MKLVKIAQKLSQEIALLIEAARQRAAFGINAEMVWLYWQIGDMLYQSRVHNQRAGYGEQFVATVSQQLSMHGRGFSSGNLWSMVRFREIFPTLEQVPKELNWTHLRQLIYVSDDLKRTFYLEMCRINKWSVRVLQERMGSMLYERTGISRKPEELIRQELAELQNKDAITQEDLIFKSPYLLGFLGLEDTYSEKDLENAILHKLEKFLVELGGDFAFGRI